MPDIRHAIFIAAPAERVHALVSTPQGFSQWWSEDVIENKAAHTVDLGFFNRATVYELSAARMAPSQTAEWICKSGQEWSAQSLYSTPLPRTAAPCCDSRMRIGRLKQITSRVAIRPGES
jgi:hypothetical protein